MALTLPAIVGGTRLEAAASLFKAPIAVLVVMICGKIIRTFAALAAVNVAAHFTGRMAVWSLSTMSIVVTTMINASREKDGMSLHPVGPITANIVIRI